MSHSTILWLCAASSRSVHLRIAETKKPPHPSDEEASTLGSCMSLPETLRSSISKGEGIVKKEGIHGMS